jgi:hypothetical protein
MEIQIYFLSHLKKKGSSPGALKILLVILSYFPGRQERRGPRIQKRKPETLANSF